MTTNLWVEQYWYDHKLVWEPEDFGGVDLLHVPSSNIWLPDIVLYNKQVFIYIWSGNEFFFLVLTVILRCHSLQRQLFTAIGLVEWKPPAIYHSSCEMDVEYFPFDEQTCFMKFGSWTYDGFQVINLGFNIFLLSTFLGQRNHLENLLQPLLV